MYLALTDKLASRSKLFRGETVHVKRYGRDVDLGWGLG